MTKTREIAQIAGAAVARMAEERAEELKLQVLTEVMTTPGMDASKLTDKNFGAILANVVTQDGAWTSKRLWSVASGALTMVALAALADQTLQAAILRFIGEHTGVASVLLIPLATNLIQTALTLLSKRDDPRPPKPPAVSGTSV